jgi:hypothetical protein
MWRIRELFYSRLGRVLLASLALAVVVLAGVLLAPTIFKSSIELPAVPMAAEVPLTPGAALCQSAIAEMDETIDTHTAMIRTPEAVRIEFFEDFAAAARSCSYAELIEFERSRIVQWSGGVAVYSSAEGSA